MRVIHTADWHLGHTFFGYDRAEEHIHFLEWLKGEIHNHSVDALIIAGDVFDTANPSASAQRLFYKFIHDVTQENPHLQIVLIAGNHDSAARLEAPKYILEIANTDVRGYIVKDQDGNIDYNRMTVYLKDREGVDRVACMCVPFVRQGDYPTVEDAENQYAEGVKKLYSEYSSFLQKNKPESVRHIVAVGHLHTLGAEIADRDHSERIVIGGLDAINTSAFDSSLSYVALGHIHKAQKVGGKENVRYSGSPIPLSFAEKNYKHSVVLVDLLCDGEVKVEKLYIPRLLQLISVPANGACATVKEVMSELERLPYCPTEPAFLEVKVLLDEPEPMLKQNIISVLENKNYRLVRIEQAFKGVSNNIEKEDSKWNRGLEDISPADVLKLEYSNKYQSELPDDIAELFVEAYNEANNVENE